MPKDFKKSEKNMEFSQRDQALPISLLNHSRIKKMINLKRKVIKVALWTKDLQKILTLPPHFYQQNTHYFRQSKNRQPKHMTLSYMLKARKKEWKKYKKSGKALGLLNNSSKMIGLRRLKNLNPSIMRFRDKLD